MSKKKSVTKRAPKKAKTGPINEGQMLADLKAAEKKKPVKKAPAKKAKPTKAKPKAKPKAKAVPSDDFKKGDTTKKAKVQKKCAPGKTPTHKVTAKINGKWEEKGRYSSEVAAMSRFSRLRKHLYPTDIVCITNLNTHCAVTGNGKLGIEPPAAKMSDPQDEPVPRVIADCPDPRPM